MVGGQVNPVISVIIDNNSNNDNNNDNNNNNNNNNKVKLARGDRPHIFTGVKPLKTFYILLH